MKCPKCQSANTSKVSVLDSAWKVGHERCNDCKYQDQWTAFADPPWVIVFNPNPVILPFK